MHTKTARARGKVRAQYRWAYATSTLLPLQEIGQNQHEKGGWAYNTSWAYNTYSTVHVNAHVRCLAPAWPAGFKTGRKLWIGP